MNIESERAAFEAWMVDVEGVRIKPRFDRATAGPFAGDYRDGQVQGAWNVWQARAALSAPAVDAGLSLVEWTKDAEEWGGALNDAGWVFIEQCPETSALLFNNTKGPLRAAIMKYAEIVAAQRAKEVE